YEALGIASTATTTQIIKAYRKKALTCHPDKVTPELQEAAARMFKIISEAYDILKDDARRADYDR
ncbi:heat shock protein DnaJ, partial [Mytilinidion resinicola]